MENVQGKKCRICTGCGRCSWNRPDMDVVTASGQQKREYERIVIPEDQEKAAEGLLVTADIGTTTVAMQLRRMTDGEVLDTFRAVNPQRKYGADVLSRIQAAGDAAREMRRSVLQVLEQGIAQFRGHVSAQSEKTSAGSIRGMVIAANTTMIYLLMGYETSELGRAPFRASHLEEIQTLIGGVPTVIMPGFSAFVGADILAGMYAWNMGGDEDTTLFIDLGTNGEMALGDRGRLTATATAAGPAFEGRFGVGIWGADAVKYLAALRKQGLVDETGLLQEPYFETGVMIGGICMTQEDIRSLQLAKAAVRAGIECLCEQMRESEPIKERAIEQAKGQLRGQPQGQVNVCPESAKGTAPGKIDRVYLAGGFGYYLDPADAAVIGLLPIELAAKCIPVGNAALEGAFCYGRKRFCGNRTVAEQAQRELCDLKAKVTVINLAECPGFQERFVEEMNFTGDFGHIF